MLPASVDRIRWLAETIRGMEHSLADAVQEALQQGVDRTCVAEALGVHRATVYRRYFPRRGGPVKAVGRPRSEAEWVDRSGHHQGDNPPLSVAPGG